MEAKDTVIDTVRIYNITGVDLTEVGQWKRLRPILEAQAEISFKAGIREVVEWTRRAMEAWFSRDELEAKLKEWFKDSPELLEKWGIK